MASCTYANPIGIESVIFVGDNQADIQGYGSKPGESNVNADILKRKQDNLENLIWKTSTSATYLGSHFLT